MVSIDGKKLTTQLPVDAFVDIAPAVSAARAPRPAPEKQPRWEVEFALGAGVTLRVHAGDALRESSVRICLYAKPTDVRRSCARVVAVVRDVMKEGPLSGHHFVLINCRETQYKILCFARSGNGNRAKRLEGALQLALHRTRKADTLLVQLKLIIEDIEVTYSLKKAPCPPSDRLIWYN